MSKEFKTYEELVDLLESRNVETDENTITQIKRESYYAIINGYKEPFLDKHAMTSSHDDVYKQGTKFEWIYALFSFDRDLRFLTFQYLTKAEALLKNAVVYAFCEKHRGPKDYLDRASYSSPDNLLTASGFRGNKETLHQKNLDCLLKILNKKVRSEGKPFTVHYNRTHGYVPLWVLQNDLTFGTISNFYQLLERDVQNKACKIVLESTGAKNGSRMTPQELLSIFSTLVDYRNICAHDERLYCAKVGKSKDVDFSDMCVKLSAATPDEDFSNFLDEILSIFAKYRTNLHVVTPQSLLREMGFEVEDRTARPNQNADKATNQTQT